MNLADLQTLFIDGDGVLWRGDKAVPGLDHLMAALAARSIDWALLTNNNTRTAHDYVQKLAGFNINAPTSHIFTSSTATADYLLDKYGEGAAVHAVGMSGLIDTLTEAGFEVSTGEAFPDHPVVAVAAGMDRAITHNKILVAMRLILGGAEFVATNLDPSFPTPEGLNPGTGMVIGSLRTVTETDPTVIGKPERGIYDAALRHLNADPITTAMIGDRLDTDILGAQRAGLGTILVLTGVTSREDLADHTIQPDLVFDSIDELATALLDSAP
jgi:4-nitrophenyl phosphatase